MPRLRWIASATLAAAALLAAWFLQRGPRVEIAAEDRSIDGMSPRPGALFQGEGGAVATFAEVASTADAGSTSTAVGAAADGPIESAATVLREAGSLVAPGAREAVLERLRRSEAQRLALARETAKRLGFPLRVVHPDGRVRELAGFVEGRPLYRETHNLNAAISTRADSLALAPFSLNGTGVTVGVWDGGSVLANHQEFATGSRVTVQDGAAADDHATHVAGTIAAAGLYAPARGMATAARIDSYDWNDDALELIARGAASPTEPGMIFLSNHSYGYLKGWVWMGGSGTPARNWEWWGSGSGPTASETAFGRYDDSAQLGDAIAHAAPYFLMFWSAGNEGLDNPSPGDPVSLSPYGSSVVNYDPALHPRGDGQHRGGYETIGHLGIAKNLVTVGSVLDAVAGEQHSLDPAVLNQFSSTGPVDDGRIKPDLVANGDSLLSPIALGPTWYAWSSGTSMSSPNAAGTAALVVQEYGNRFPGQAMRSSTLRGLLIHTADDLGATGPDYRYGWGLVNGLAAAEQIRADADHPLQARIGENFVSGTETVRTTEFLWDGVSPIVATLCWTDPPAGPSGDDSRVPTLVNNLDLKIVGPDGSEHLPWKMPFVGTWTTASLAEPAGRGLNDTDNVEQVRIASPPAPGRYRCEVGFRGVLEDDRQDFSLLVSGSANPSVPSVGSPSAVTVVASAASLGGNVTADGGAGITERGVVYSASSTNADPVIGGPGVTKVTASGTTGAFSEPVTGLSPGTAYHYKAYATNPAGTGYSAAGTFTTLSNNADLAGLVPGQGTLSPAFAAGTTGYSLAVPNATDSLSVTATTAQAGATLVVRINGGTGLGMASGTASPALPLNVGSNTVEVGVTAEDGVTMKTYTITVTRDKASQTIAFSNPGPRNAAGTVPLSAIGGGSGNPVIFTVEGPAFLGPGDVLAFTGAGTVTVRANQNGNDFHHPAPEVAHSFIVTKAMATVTLDSLSQTYDGTPKPATATTDPAGKTVVFTYDGAATAPTNAGSHEVTGTIDDPIYQGSASGTLRIAKAAQAITFDAIPDQLTTDTFALSATGGGSGNPVTFAVTSGPATIDGGVLSFPTAGEVTVTASQAGNANYEDATSVSRTFTVTKATATVTLGSLSQTYDGTPKSATAATDPAGKTVVFTYDGTPTAPTNARSYAVVGTIDDPIYQGTASGTLRIAKASQTITFPAIPDQLATDTVTLSATGGASGNPVTFAVTSGPATIDAGVLSFSNSGEVTVTASQAGNANYEVAPDVSRTFTVSKATATLILSRLHQVADGTAREVVVTTVPEDLAITVTYAGAANAPIAPGFYDVVATSADDRYEGSDSDPLVVDDPARSVVVSGGSLPALSTLGALSVPTFRLGAYEVTGSQWAEVVTWAEAEAEYDFGGAGSAASGDRPVTGISWYDAAKWCNARTEWENALLGRTLAPAYRIGADVYKTGTPASPADLTCDFGAGGYRLPTAAEWEYAARGGASGVPATYPGGDTLDELGWYVGNSNGAVQPAGGKTANSLDLYDLAGNAAEWTWDAPSGSPGQRLLRGGAWSSAASACELSAPFAGETPVLRLDRAGFRVAKSISLALAAALDDPNLDWESGGEEVWFAQSTPTHDGTDAAESGAIAPGQSSWLETTVTGPCNVRFRWEASQRAALDVFRLETGTGDPILLTGPGNWEERLVELPAGEHLLRWVFARDAASTGPSRVRLDAVSVTPATVPTVTTAAASGVSGSGATLGGEVTTDGGRTVTARGVVYSTSPAPTLASPDVLTAASAGTGTFHVTASGLTEGTTYFARAYATNNLGTAYGAEIVLTTDTNVVFADGIGTVSGRTILAGDTQRFGFVLNGPRLFALTTSDGEGLEVRLFRDDGEPMGNGVGGGNPDLRAVLEAGTYWLHVHRPDGGQDEPTVFSLNLDARTEAVTRPDAMVGKTLGGMIGGGIHGSHLVQQLRLTSRGAVPVTAVVAISNRGNRPDRIAVSGSGDSRLFRVAYRDPGGSPVTAAIRLGNHLTPEREPGASPDWLTMSVTPSKSLLTIRRGRLTKTRRSEHTFIIKTTSMTNPGASDAVSTRVETR
jgi:hypothetical protein